MSITDADGSVLLTSAAVGELLSAAVRHAGGELSGWRLRQVDADPARSTTATYSATVRWPWGSAEETVGVSARTTGPSDADHRALVFEDGRRQVAVWLYPHDPDLPGLARASSPERVAELLGAQRVVPAPVAPRDLDVEVVGYRPRRRAVLRVAVAGSGPTFYLKVVRPARFVDLVERHRLLAASPVPAAEPAFTTSDGILGLHRLSGRSLARAVLDDDHPVSAEALVGVLDALPRGIARLPRRNPWAASVHHYADVVGHALPDQWRRTRDLAEAITQGLSGLDAGDEPTHGDFHEGQLHVRGGRVTGLLDVDTLGPGRRADDLACLLAHLSTIQRMDRAQTARVHGLIRAWTPVFDDRVDPTELRLRTAAVVISLATGPYRLQERDWGSTTRSMVDAAEALVRQVR